MNKSIWLICILLFIPSILIAQDIAVQSFVLAEKDFTANTHGTVVLDYNGDACALIKVETNEKGFVFDGGITGIISVVEQSDEIWVYVPEGLKRIGISHPQLGVLEDYWMPMPIEAGKTYIMKLVNERPELNDDGSNGDDGIIGKEEENILLDLKSAIRLYDTGEYDLCLYFLYEPILAGNGLAHVLLGNLYYSGKGVEQDYGMAFNCFAIAADKGTPEAFTPLAMCYYNGYGVEKNEDYAYLMLLYGIEKGDEQAIELKKKLFGDE